MKLNCKRCKQQFENKDRRVKYCLEHRSTINKSDLLIQLEQKEQNFIQRLLTWKI